MGFQTQGIAGLVLLALTLSGCAGTRTQIPKLSPVTRADMHERFKEGIPHSLHIPEEDREEFARNISIDIHGAAIRVCQDLFGPEYQCLAKLSRYRVSIKPSNPTVNAQIDPRNRITIFGGLIRRVGSEGELASVLAHEYGHGLMGHVKRKMQNTLKGALVGLAVGAVVGAKANDPYAARTGTNMGATMGSLVYSQAMENEADHVGLFILREAGYDLKTASHFFMRLLNERRFTRGPLKKTHLQYLRTHPAHKERIQKLMAAEKRIASGQTLPDWKRQKRQP